MIVITALTDRPQRAALGYMLRAAGAEVVHAQGPEAALAAVGEHRPDVLLAADDLDGGVLTLIDAIKQDPTFFGTAVVIVGDALDQEQILEAMRRGAADVLRHPDDGADVVARTFAATRTKALVEELTAQNDRLVELVSFDELTGLRNRRAILAELDMLIAGADRHGRPVSICMLDVDHFKAINDRLGHRVGDEVLREIARRLEARLRREDSAGRLGGDELLVLLPETEADGAAILAQELCDGVMAGAIATSAGLVDVTASLGCAAWRGEEAAELLDRADSALYAAKAGGRARAALA